MGFGSSKKSRVFDKGVDGKKIFDMETGVNMMKGKKMMKKTMKNVFEIGNTTKNLRLDGSS